MVEAKKVRDLASRVRSQTIQGNTITSIEAVREHLMSRVNSELRSRIPKEFWNARWHDFRTFAEKPDTHPKGFCLRGKTGIGKTRLAAALTLRYCAWDDPNCIADENNNLVGGLDYNNRIAWIRGASLMSEVKSSFGRNGMSAFEIESYYAKKGLLIIDDFGAENSTEFTSATFLEIISRRIEYCRPTIITTNLEMKEIALESDRLASRLSEFATVKLPEEDWRMKGGN